MSERMKVLSHRGLSDDGERENSLEAFAAAVARGVEGIELDIRQTGDGVLVISHDAVVAGVDIGRARRAELAERAPYVCSLAEALEVIPASCLMDAEVKVHGVEEAVLRELARKRGPRDFVVTSFHDGVISAIKALAPDVRTGLVLGEGRPKEGILARLSEYFPAGRMRRCGAEVVVPNWKLLRCGFLRRAARHGYDVWVWTVNDPSLIRHMSRHPEVGAIISDRPAKAMALRDQTSGLSR